MAYSALYSSALITAKRPEYQKKSHICRAFVIACIKGGTIFLVEYLALAPVIGMRLLITAAHI